MQEVFEKIDAILQKYRKKWLEQPNTEPCKELECISNDCVDCMLTHLENDINQVAEEYVPDINVVNNNGWIPCSERLPEKRDWYLAVFKEPDTGFIGLPYIADYLMGNHTAYTTKDGWIIKDCTDRYDCESLYHKQLECIAWQPLPEPYKGD